MKKRRDTDVRALYGPERKLEWGRRRDHQLKGGKIEMLIISNDMYGENVPYRFPTKFGHR